MKKIFFLFLMILVLAFPFACSTSTHVDDSSSFSSSNGQAVFFSLSVKDTANGRVEIAGGVTQARLGEKISLNVIPNENYEVVWVKINKGNHAEDKIVYSQEDINSGVIADLIVEYDMVIDACFALPSQITTSTPTYIGQPETSVSIRTNFNVTKVTCVNGQISADVVENIASGQTVTITATANSGYKVGQILVRKASTYELVSLGEGNTFTMPEDDVAIMATFIPV